MLTYWITMAVIAVSIVSEQNDANLKDYVIAILFAGIIIPAALGKLFVKVWNRLEKND